MKHCETCTCETPAERQNRLAAEAAQRVREQREHDFVVRHSVLTDDDVAWARKRLETGR